MTEPKDSYTSYYVAGAILDVCVWAGIIGAFYWATLAGVIFLGVAMIVPNFPLPGELFREHARIEQGTDRSPAWLDMEPPAKTPPPPDYARLVGSIGEAHTALRPQGDVIIDGEVVQARCERDYIQAGASIKVVRAMRGTVVVELEQAPANDALARLDADD